MLRKKSEQVFYFHFCVYFFSQCPVAKAKEVLNDLRAMVHRIEENKSFEKMKLQGSQIAHETLPTTGDIDRILSDLMKTSSVNINHDALQAGPWKLPQQLPSNAPETIESHKRDQDYFDQDVSVR
jgi:hypothetical protein